MLDQITPLVLTLNESPNISRTLSHLSWAKRVVVVDSFSDDDTAMIAKAFPNVVLLLRRFDSHASQWNFGLHDTGIDTEWVLALDADYMLTEAIVQEISLLRPSEEICGYQAAFKYCINGKPLRGTLYPPTTVLYRKGRTSYVQDGHTQRARLQGKVLRLNALVLHDDRKSLDRWISSQIRYMKLEADKLSSTPIGKLSLADQVRRMVLIAPLAAFLYCWIARGAIFDGVHGLFYSLQRAVAEAILSLYILERLLARARV